jgi:hypothetical protein
LEDVNPQVPTAALADVSHGIHFEDNVPRNSGYSAVGLHLLRLACTILRTEKYLHTTAAELDVGYS